MIQSFGLAKRVQFGLLATLLALSFFCSTGYAEERPIIDAFFGGGIANNPGGSDFTGNIIFGAGYRPIKHLSVGLEGIITDMSSDDRLFLDLYGSLYPLPNKFANLYVKGGLGFINIDMGQSSSRSTEARLIPMVGAGLELGWKYVSLFGETTLRFNSSSSGSSTLSAISVGLSGHFYK